MKVANVLKVPTYMWTDALHTMFIPWDNIDFVTAKLTEDGADYEHMEVHTRDDKYYIVAREWRKIVTDQIDGFVK